MKTALETIDLVLPSHWASALINSDESGLEDNEIRDLNETLEFQGVGACCGCSDETIDTKWHDGCGETCDGLFCECLTFTFYVK